MAEQIDLADYISRTEELHKKGKNYFIKCPFHRGDDTPSLAIYPDSNTWYCFGCSAGSTIYDWLQKAEGLSFPEAVKKVVDITGSEVTDCVESESVSFFKDMNIQDAEQTTERTQLDFDKDYLQKYSDELPEEWIKEGMATAPLKAFNIRIDHNANRIVYPVFDADGRFIGVKGRTRLECYKELGIAKYINYNKIGTIDYFQGWQQADFKINNRKSVIIFEGVKSCIKAYGWEIKNTIASETAALSDGQLELLIKNGFDEVIFGWDKGISFKSIADNSKIQMLRKFTNVSIITDNYNMLDDKDAPVDKGEDVFRKLLEWRVAI